MAEHNEGFLAGRLIQWGLDPRSRPAQESEYQGLIERYLDREPFRNLVQEVSRGMGLLILDVGEHGLILAPTEESFFALRPAQFRPTSASTDDRLVDGLVQLAVASTIFPRDRDLDDDSSIARPATTVEEVEETLRTICQRLEEDSRGRPDPSAAEEDIGLYEAWRVFKRRLRAMETRDDRKAQRTTRRAVEYGLDRLREFGCFTKAPQGDDATYQPTYRYQVLVKQLAATAAFQALQRIMKGEGHA